MNTLHSSAGRDGYEEISGDALSGGNAWMSRLTTTTMPKPHSLMTGFTCVVKTTLVLESPMFEPGLDGNHCPGKSRYKTNSSRSLNSSHSQT